MGTAIRLTDKWSWRSMLPDSGIAERFCVLKKSAYLCCYRICPHFANYWANPSLIQYCIFPWKNSHIPVKKNSSVVLQFGVSISVHYPVHLTPDNNNFYSKQPIMGLMRECFISELSFCSLEYGLPLEKYLRSS